MPQYTRLLFTTVYLILTILLIVINYSCLNMVFYNIGEVSNLAFFFQFLLEHIYGKEREIINRPYRTARYT